MEKPLTAAEMSRMVRSLEPHERESIPLSEWAPHVLYPGRACTVNDARDLYFDYAARAFIGAACVVVERTKAGLIQVALRSDQARTMSFPIRNIDVVPEPSQD